MRDIYLGRLGEWGVPVSEGQRSSLQSLGRM